MTFERYRCSDCYYEGDTPCPTHMNGNGQSRLQQNQTPMRAMTDQERKDSDDFFMSKFYERNAKDHVEESKRLLSHLLNDFHNLDEAERIIECAERQLTLARESMKRGTEAYLANVNRFPGLDAELEATRGEMVGDSKNKIWAKAAMACMSECNCGPTEWKCGRCIAALEAWKNLVDQMSQNIRKAESEAAEKKIGVKMRSDGSMYIDLPGAQYGIEMADLLRIYQNCKAVLRMKGKI